MPSRDRSRWRNVHFYNASNTLLGGFFQAGSVTDANLIWILQNVLLVQAEHLTITHRASDRIITPSNNPVVPGDYIISCDGTVRVTDEAWFARVVSFSESGQEDSFCTRVRQRDGRCVISGDINLLAPWDIWDGLQAAHIFPLERAQYNLGRWIRNIDPTTGVSKNSIQNGLLISATLHGCFDQYMFSINPDDGYKIVSFVPDSYRIDGKVLDPICRDPNDPDHVADELLRWHFRQSVLANMRGAGEPIFESDFPPGTDRIATLRDEPYGKKRFEMEVELRLGPRAREENSTYE